MNKESRDWMNIKNEVRPYLKLRCLDQHFIVSEGTTVIEEEEYRGNLEAQYVTLPDSLEEIGAGAFMLCTNLTTINIPPKVRAIGPCAFVCCPHLKRVDVHPDNPHFHTVADVLIHKETNSILFCPQFKEGNYVVPDGIEAIGINAFGDCTNLTVHAPEGSFAEYYAKLMQFKAEIV